MERTYKLALVVYRNMMAYVCIKYTHTYTYTFIHTYIRKVTA